MRVAGEREGDSEFLVFHRNKDFIGITRKRNRFLWEDIYSLVFLYINLFILFYLFYFWLHWVFIAARSLSLVAVRGLLIAVASLVAEHGL